MPKASRTPTTPPEPSAEPTGDFWEGQPHWYTMKTLLGCAEGSDINRRLLYHKDRCVAVFNYGMREWHVEDDEALRKVVLYLEKLR